MTKWKPLPDTLTLSEVTRGKRRRRGGDVGGSSATGQSDMDRRLLASAEKASDKMKPGLVAPSKGSSASAVIDVEAAAAEAEVKNRSLTTQIVNRATIVQRPFNPIGFFEFAVWCFMRKRNINLCIGTNWVAIDELYPALQVHTRSPDSKAAIHIVGCCWDEELNAWAALHDLQEQELSHYVIASQVGPAVSENLHPRLDLQMKELGYMVICTAAQGDCGIDALVFYDLGMDRGGAAHWKNLRLELHRFMIEHAEEEYWHELFRSCQESVFDDMPGDTPPSLTSSDTEEDDARGAESSTSESSSDDDVSDSDSEMGAALDEPKVGAGKASSSAAGSQTNPLALQSAEGASAPSGEKPGASTGPHGTKGLSEPGASSAAGSQANPLALQSAEGASASSGEKPGASTGPHGPKGLSDPGGLLAPKGSHTDEQAEQGAAIATTGDSVNSATCSHPQGYRNETTFRKHLKTLSKEKLWNISADLRKFQNYEAQFFSEHPHLQELSRKRPISINRVSTLVHQRLALGHAFQKWLTTPEGKAAKKANRHLRAYLTLGTERQDRDVTKAETMRLTRAWHLALEQDLREGRLDGADSKEKTDLAKRVAENALKDRRRRGQTGDRLELPHEMPTRKELGRAAKRPCENRVSADVRRRRLRLQGRTFKCPGLRQRLYDWFIDVRSCYAKISPGTVKRQALTLANAILKECRKNGEFVSIPRITYPWVRGWRREYQISLRKPNAKYKVSRATLLARLTVMWRTNVRLRWLAKITLNRNLGAWGCDQKPIYMNEGGHKNQPTLHLAGAGDVLLKSCVAQTRQRISLMTTVSSLAQEARASTLPVELCFKGKTGRTLKKLPKNFGGNVYFQYSPKGSYRAEHVVRFLRKALPAWTEERARTNDWRMLYLDAYKAHFAQEVLDVAWSRGFIVVWHGAGTTGICQVNDTHLHDLLEREYIELEAESFAHQQALDPSDISRSRTDVAFDVVSTWNAVNHERACKGHWSNGLANALDGTEDLAMRAEVRELWDACDMDRWRSEAREEIKAKVEAGELRWDRASIESITGGNAAENWLGAYKTEGRELEAAQQENESVWEDKPSTETDDEREERQEQAAAKAKAAASDETGAAPHEIGGVVVTAQATDTDADKKVAEAFAGKKKLLEDLRQQAVGEDMAPFRWTLDRKLRTLVRSHWGTNGPQRPGDDLVRRFLQAKHEVEQVERMAKRKKIQKAKQKLVKQQVLKKKLANEKAARVEAMAKAKLKEQAEKAAAKAKESLKTRRFDLADLLPAKAKEQDNINHQARIDFLERMRVKFGLKPEEEAYWVLFRGWYADWVRVKKAGAGAAMFEVLDTVEKANSKFPGAFNAWVKKTWAEKPVPASSRKF